MSVEFEKNEVGIDSAELIGDSMSWSIGWFQHERTGCQWNTRHKDEDDRGKRAAQQGASVGARSCQIRHSLEGVTLTLSSVHLINTAPCGPSPAQSIIFMGADFPIVLRSLFRSTCIAS
jgi:hypothetical protein